MIDNNRYRSDYRPPEPPTDWHDQDWLLILVALDQYARTGDVTAGQELRAYQLVKSIARFQGTVSLGAIQRLTLNTSIGTLVSDDVQNSRNRSHRRTEKRTLTRRW